MKQLAFEEAQILPIIVVHTVPVRWICLTHRFVLRALMRVSGAMTISLKGAAFLSTVE